MKKKQSTSELEALFTELTSAVDRSKFTKARRLRDLVQHKVWEVEEEKVFSDNELNALEARLDKICANIPVPTPRKSPKKTKSQLRREAHWRFLAKNNTYTPGS